MAAVTVTNKLVDLKKIFNEANHVYFKSDELTKTDLSGASLTVDFELPVLEEGVTFDTGAAEVTNIRLTTKTIWTAKADKGDPDITLQVASFASEVNEVFLTKVASATVASAAGLIDGKTFAGQGYKLAPKKVTGSLIVTSQDDTAIVVLPSVEIFASLVLADGDNPAYFNASVTPVENSEGVEIYILHETEGA